MNTSVAGDRHLADVSESTASGAYASTASAHTASPERCRGAPEQTVENGIRTNLLSR